MKTGFHLKIKSINNKSRQSGFLLLVSFLILFSGKMWAQNASISGTTTVCQGSPSPVVTFTGENGTAPYIFIYTVTINGVTGLPVTTSPGNNITVSVPTGTADTYIYELVNAKDGGGNDCSIIISTATVTVNPSLAADVSIIATANNVCTGTSVTFTATPVNGGTPTYQWYKNAVAVGLNSPTYSYTPLNGDYVYVVMTSSLPCVTGSPATSNTVTITVNGNLPVSVSIAASDNPVCTGTSVTFTATPVNGGTPTYQWYRNSSPVGTNSPTYLYTPANGDQIYVVMTSNLSCITGSPATSGTVTMTTNTSLPVSVTIAASANPVCAGTPVTFTATPVNGGTPTYQWYKNSVIVGSNSPTYSYTPLNGDHVYVVMTSNLSCITGSPATSNTVTLTVNASLPVSVSIAASANPVCSGTSVTLTATPANGGTLPGYQWKVNGINVGTNNATYTYIPVNNDLVSCILTSNASCATGNPATSNTVTMTVTPTVGTPTPITVSGGTEPTCQLTNGTTTTTYATTATNNTGFIWSLSNSAAGSIVTTTGVMTWANGFSGNVNIQVRANGCNGPSLMITRPVTVTPGVGIPSTPSPSLSTICQGSANTSYTTSATNATSYNWSVTGTGNTISGTGTTGTVTWAAGFSGLATVSVTANGCNGTAAAGSTTVTVRPSPAPTISGTTTVCQNATAPNITFTNPQALPVTITYNINGANQTTIAVGASTSSTIAAPTTVPGVFAYNLVSVVYQTAPSCSRIITGTATVTVTPTVGAPVTPTPSVTTICQGSSNTAYTTSATNAISYNWSVTGTGNTISGTGITGTVTWATGFSGSATVSVTANGCNGPSGSASTTVTVRPTPTATISGTTTVCQNATAPNITFTNPRTLPVTVTYNINGANQSTVAVGASSSATVTVPTTTPGVFAYNLVSVVYQAVPACSNAITGTATVTVNPSPVPTLTSSDANNIICAGTSVTFTAGGGTSYNFLVGGVSVQSGTSATYTTSSLTNGQVVSVIASNSTGCSATSAGITNIVNQLPFIFVSTLPACAANLATYSLAVTVGSGTVTSTSGTVTSLGSNIWSIAGVLARTNITVRVTDLNGCISAIVVTAPNCLCPSISAPVSGGDKSYCESGIIPALTATVLPGETIDWYNSSSGGTLLLANSLSYTPSAAGIYYALARNATSNCVSSTRTPVTLTMNALPIPVLTSSDPDNVLCAGTNVTFTTTGGTNYNFRVGSLSVQNGPSPTYTTNSLTNGQVVSVIVTNALGCTATSAGITNTVNALPTPNPGTGGNECDLNFTFNAVPTIGTGTWTLTTGPGTATFTPNANTPTATVTVSGYGTYTFTWTEVSGTCSKSSPVTVNFYQQPAVSAGTSGNNCGLEFNLNGSLNIGTGTWSKVSGPGNATFTPNANTSNAKVSVTVYGSYTFRWTVINGTCSNSATVIVIFIMQPPANAGAGGNECDKDFVMNATTTPGTGTWTKISGPGVAVFTPDSHKTNAKVTVDQIGTYDFAWTVVNSICTSTDIVRVAFHDPPLINAGIDTAICKNGSIQLHAEGIGSFVWTPTASVSNPDVPAPVATPDTTTTYLVTLTDQFGCKKSDDVKVEVRVNPVANAGPDQVLEYQLKTTLDAELTYDYETGIWSLISGTGEIFDTTYSKTSVSGLSLDINQFLWKVTNRVCPPSSDTVTITVHDFIIPTLITPNLDGKNDYFVIRGLTTLGKTELLIFDRRGVMVYKSRDYDNSWDGVDYNDNPLPDDTYFFVMKAQNGISMKGYIVIRR